MSNDTGSELRRLRLSRRILQYELAAAAGVSPTVLRQIENGRRPVSAYLSARIRDIIETAVPEDPA